MPVLKNKLLRETFCLVFLSLGLSACQPALVFLPPFSRPSSLPLFSATSRPDLTESPAPPATLSPPAIPSPALLPASTPFPSPATIRSPVLQPSPTVVPVTAGWRLAWHDEFGSAAGLKPNPKNWTYDLGGGGWGNNELEYYTDSAKNASTDGRGSLAITAIRYADPKTSGLSCSDCLYSSARLVTRDRFTFQNGLFEVRMRLPAGQGLWPAFWMLGSNIDQVGWPECGEIDVMENKGSQPVVVRGSLHGPGYSVNSALTRAYSLAGGSFTDDFHVFAVEWSAAEIRWYVDGQQYFSVKKGDLSGRWVFDHPFNLILNLAVGGTFAGSPDRNTTFPQTLLVDYVRVYQKSSQ